MKIVINATNNYLGFTLSNNTAEEYKRLKGKTINRYTTERHDENLIKAVEKYIHENPNLKIVEIPDDVKYKIQSDNDGIESIHEIHRVWR